jgi:hypothetical protein
VYSKWAMALDWVIFASVGKYVSLLTVMCTGIYSTLSSPRNAKKRASRKRALVSIIVVGTVGSVLGQVSDDWARKAESERAIKEHTAELAKANWEVLRLQNPAKKMSAVVTFRISGKNQYVKAWIERNTRAYANVLGVASGKDAPQLDLAGEEELAQWYGRFEVNFTVWRPGMPLSLSSGAELTLDAHEWLHINRVQSKFGAQYDVEIAVETKDGTFFHHRPDLSPTALPDFAGSSCQMRCTLATSPFMPVSDIEIETVKLQAPEGWTEYVPMTLAEFRARIAKPPLSDGDFKESDFDSNIWLINRRRVAFGYPLAG